MSCACAIEPKQHIRLTGVVQHSTEVYSLDFESIFPLEWDAGAHCKVFVKTELAYEGKTLSYASIPQERIIRFTTRISDKRSAYKSALAKLAIGDLVEVTLPKVNIKLMREDRPILFLSNGVGIAAIRPFVKAYESNKNGIPHVIQLNVDSSGPIYQDEFSAISLQNPLFESYYLQHRQGFYSKLDVVLQGLFESHEKDPYIYIIGSEGFVRETFQYLIEMGISDEQLIIDQRFKGLTTCGCSPDNGCGCGANLVQLA